MMPIMSAANTTMYNSTQADNSSPDDERHELPPLESPPSALNYTVITLTVCVFLIGLVSWKMIKKFRHFKNFVLLNTIFITMIDLSLGTVHEYVYNVYYSTASHNYTSMWVMIIHDAVTTYVSVVTYCWMLVLCWIFYVDIVKVFGPDVARRYLKSSLFAWGGPLIVLFVTNIVLHAIAFPLLKSSSRETAAKYINAFPIFEICVMFVPLIINFLIYLRVIFTLFNKSTVLSKGVVKTHRFYIATLIFLLSGVVQLLGPLFYVLDFPMFFQLVVYYLQTIVMNIYFLVVKSNRSLWYDFYVKRFKKDTVVAIR